MGNDQSPHALAGEHLDQCREGRRRPVPRVFAQALGPRIEADRQPIGGYAQAGAQRIDRLGHRPQGHHDARCTAGKGKLDLLRAVDAAGQLERHGDGLRDALQRLGVGRLTALGPVEVDQVEHRRAQTDEMPSDPFGPVGRGAGAACCAGPEDQARAAALEVDARDELHQTGVASSRRWKLIGRLP